MTRAQAIARAVKRFGKDKPSPDDILTEYIGAYVGPDARRTYREMTDEVVALAESSADIMPGGRRHCAWCGEPKPLKNCYYCSPECRDAARSVERYCKTCNSLIPRPKSVSARNYADRVFCSSECRVRQVLSEDERTEIAARFLSGEPAVAIARDFGCHRSTVYQIVKQAA